MRFKDQKNLIALAKVSKKSKFGNLEKKLKNFLTKKSLKNLCFFVFRFLGEMSKYIYLNYIRINVISIINLLGIISLVKRYSKIIQTIFV